MMMFFLREIECIKCLEIKYDELFIVKDIIQLYIYNLSRWIA